MVQPNVILIVLDTCRADTVAEMLNSGELSGLEKFSKVGTTYTNAYTSAPWTLPSHASMFTGQRSSDHGTHAGHQTFDPSVPTIPELLSDVGYTTVGISGNSWVSGEFGFDKGFDNLSMKWDRFWGGDDLSSVSRAKGKRRIQLFKNILLSRQAPITVTNAVWAKLKSTPDFGTAQTTNRTLKWLRSNERQNPFFYFINYLEPHLPYEPPEEFRRHYVGNRSISEVNQDPWEYVAGDVEMSESDFELLDALYRAEISYLDSHLDRLYEQLRASQLLDSTAVFIVGDHGENIGDHRLMDHQYSLHESLLHVPLIVHYPGQETTEVESNLVEVRDIYPTIASLANANYPDDSTVSSIDLSDGMVRDAVFAEYRYPQPNMESLERSVENLSQEYRNLDQTLRSVRTTMWKLIEYEDNDVRLYHAGDESKDKSKEYPQIVDELIDRMEENGVALSRGESERAQMSAQSRKRLEDLGYI